MQSTLSDIDAILLDAAGTLIAPAEPVAETYARFARQHGVEIEIAKLKDAFRAVFDDMPPMAFSARPKRVSCKVMWNPSKSHYARSFKRQHTTPWGPLSTMSRSA